MYESRPNGFTNETLKFTGNGSLFSNVVSSASGRKVKSNKNRGRAGTRNKKKGKKIVVTSNTQDKQNLYEHYYDDEPQNRAEMSD